MNARATHGMRFILVSLALVGLTSACGYERRINRSIAASVAAGPGTHVMLAEYTTFAWDKVCILGPYTEDARVDSLTGIQGAARQAHDIRSSDSVNVLMFIREARVAASVAHPRDQGDFGPDVVGKCYSKEQAYFSVRVKPADSWGNIGPLAEVLPDQTARELVVSVGHAGAPSHAAFAGAYLATASWSNVALIDLSSGLTTTHLGHGSLVMSLETSHTGEMLAVGACDHSIRLWDVKSRRQLRHIALIQECADSVSFSPDGAFLATGAYGCCPGGGGLQVWDVTNGTLVREIAKGTGMRSVVFGRDGRWLIGIDDKKQAHVFEWPSGRQLRTYVGLDGAGASESAALASPDGKYFAWLGMRELKVWDMSTGTLVPLQPVTASTAEFLNDGRLAYVDDDRLVILTLPNGPMQELPLESPKTEWSGDVGFTQSPSWLRIRRDGLMLAGSYDSRTVLWDFAAKKLRDLVAPALTSAGSLEWSRSGVVAWADFQSGVRAWSDRSGEPIDVGSEINFATALAFHPEGQRLAVADSSSIHIIDLQRRRSVSSLELPPTTRTGIAFSPDGSRLAFAASEGLAFFDGRLRQQRQLAKPEKYEAAEYVAFSPDGRWVAAGLAGPQPTVRVWPSVGSGEAVTLDTNRLTYGPQPPAFSGDSRWLATFSKGDSVMLWSTGSWALARRWKLSGTGKALAFAPQGSRLAIAGDSNAAIWDASTGRTLVTLTSPGSSQTTQIAWSPDGNRVATSADDGVLRFWNASDGRLVASLYTLAASRDWLLVAADGRVDGSERALTSLVAWRAGDQVSFNKSFTDRRRVPRLWRSLAQ
jgi:WD40 repeat protein